MDGQRGIGYGGGDKYDRRCMADSQRMIVLTAAADRQLPQTPDPGGRG